LGDGATIARKPEMAQAKLLKLMKPLLDFTILENDNPPAFLRSRYLHQECSRFMRSARINRRNEAYGVLRLDAALHKLYAIGERVRNILSHERVVAETLGVTFWSSILCLC